MSYWEGPYLHHDAPGIEIWLGGDPKADDCSRILLVGRGLPKLAGTPHELLQLIAPSVRAKPEEVIWSEERPLPRRG